ncbi:MAG: M28 family peptidase [Ignavibacteriaceae bacterium]|nr:M28 family peptidase [Ignavibacteriaceae bacterium]
MKFLLMKISFLLFLFTQFIIAQEYNKTVFNIEIASESIKENTRVLASDIFEGRGTGTTGGNLAAKYIASEFAKYGLKPVGQENSFYQNIPMHGSYPLKSSELKIYSDDDEIFLELDKDYLLYKSGQQTFTPVPLPLVFVGFGIVAPEYDYNDYQEIDVEGKIVVFLDGEPESDDPEFFNGEAPTVYNYPISKQRIALSRGAAGSILIPDILNSSWEKIVDEFAFEDINLAYSASNNLSLIINPDEVDHIFKNSEFDYAWILAMKYEHTLKSFPLNVSLTFKGEYLQRDFLAQNVAGMLEGSDTDLKDSYLIISAHYDHLGIGPVVNGDSIYNGALDNAIGVSVLLELARQFSESNKSVKRSIIFLAVTGEEKGLLGSTYYTDNPLVPLYKTIANLNIDGIAFFRDFQTVVGVGSELSSLENILSETAIKMGLQVEPIPQQFKVVEAFNQSDQLSFASAGIPSILVLEGTKNKNKSEEEVLYAFIDYMINRYHTPFDDLSQDIDYVAAAQHTGILFELAFSIVNSETVPEWKAGSPFINARLRSIAEKK